MTDELLTQLYAVAMRNIRKQWNQKDTLNSFVSKARFELLRLQGEYKYQQAHKTMLLVDEKLHEAAQKLQLTVTTALESTRFPRFSGISVRVNHKNVFQGEIFIGPSETWDKLAYLPAHGGLWSQQDNPYTKKRRNKWQTISQFDFGTFISAIKTGIDRPPPLYEDDEDEIPF